MTEVHDPCVFRPTEAHERRPRHEAITRLGIITNVWGVLLNHTLVITLSASKLPPGKRGLGAAELLARAEMESCVQEVVHGRPTGAAALVAEQLRQSAGFDLVFHAGWRLQALWYVATTGGSMTSWISHALRECAESTAPNKLAPLDVSEMQWFKDPFEIEMALERQCGAVGCAAYRTCERQVRTAYGLPSE